MGDAPRWVVVVVVAVLVIGLIALARGRDHQRGDETGSGSIASAAFVVGS
jgi:preprotein translocase subunit SecG